MKRPKRIERIEWPTVGEVDALRPYVRRVLFALGFHPDEVWVSDESLLGDFEDLAGRPAWAMFQDEVIEHYPTEVKWAWMAGQHNKRLLARVRRIVGMPVTWRCSILAVAKRLQKGKEESGAER